MYMNNKIKYGNILSSYMLQGQELFRILKHSLSDLNSVNKEKEQDGWPGLHLFLGDPFTAVQSRFMGFGQDDKCELYTHSSV